MSGLPDAQQNNEQILNDIQSLQTMEQDLFNNLESNSNLTTQQQQQIIEKINQISNMRINLYQTLGGVNGFYQGALDSSIGTLKEQTAAIAIVEDELNRAKERLRILEEEKNNKIRLVEINTYYGEKYAEHTSLMKIIIFTLIPIILFTVLNKKGFLPNTIFYVLIGIVSVIGAYFFWMRMGSIITRDNMNYQEYDWYFNPGSAPAASSTTTNDPWLTTGISGVCIGSACCSSNQTYDASTNLCVDATKTTERFTNNSTSSISDTPITESMINSILTKTSGNMKTDYTIDGNNRVKPSSQNSFINFGMNK